jgi:type II secretory pathway component GspD/PulD (secretin)
VPVAPTLDILPRVTDDKFSIDMNIMATIPEFVGYDQASGKLDTDMEGKPVSGAVLDLPHFRLRQKTTSVTIWDSQTVVLSGTLVGQSELTTNSSGNKAIASPARLKNVMIFITPTIIMPDGTRYHTDAQIKDFQQTNALVPAVFPGQSPK